jgi:hypothetical protein
MEKQVIQDGPIQGYRSNKEIHTEIYKRLGIDAIRFKNDPSGNPDWIAIVGKPNAKPIVEPEDFGAKPGKKPSEAAIKKMTKAAIPIEDTQEATDVGSMAKDTIVTELHKSLMDDPSIDPNDNRWTYSRTNTLVAQWARTSNDDSQLSMRIQDAARRTLGGNLTEWQKDRLAKTLGYKTNTSDPSKEYTDQELDQFVRATYAQTQKWFKDRGITHLHLYRGVDGSGATNIPATEVKNIADAKKQTPIVNNAISSWSTSLKVADQFAYSYGSKHDGLVVRMTVPVEDVFSTAVTGNGCLYEWEAVLIGKKNNRGIIYSYGTSYK